MISVNNIYWMLAYALRNIKEDKIEEMSSETFENIYELFSVMLVQELSKQIKRGLHKEYILKSEELINIRGKMLFTESIKNNSFIKNKIVCEFDEYSLDSKLNRIVKTAGFYLIKSNKINDKEKIRKLKKVLCFLSDVSLIDRKDIQWSLIRYNKNNLSYKILINISYLILDGLLICKQDGNIEFLNYIDDQKLYTLYEKFVLEYYRYHHPELNPGLPQIKWDIDEKECLLDLLPKMQTDIVLTNNDQKLIIDAKYYSNIFQNNPLYDKNTFKSNNLYQIYTYVKNEDKEKTGNICGLLLYAKTDENDIVWNEYNMDGNIIIIANIDLSKTFDLVKNKLESIVDWFFKK
ncbi:MAG: 5-methylcytosine-specific restriction endonuclease system specificity protein McrC [Bacilli bacterium]|nr:5-methylcytosine-specific restriction endonuclease system specificity protein McrC [Bacilli bacterium]